MKCAQYLEYHEGVPHVVWARVNEELKNESREKKEEAYAECIRDWLSVLTREFTPGNGIYESKTIFYYTHFPSRIAQARLNIIIDVKNALRDAFGEIAAHDWIGKHLVLEFEDIDTYYRYISYFYPPVKGKRKTKTIPASGGLLTGKGYLPIVLNVMAKRQLSGVMAHEMTHLFMAPYEIASWLNEGLAMNAEGFFTRKGYLYTHDDYVEKHFSYWNKRKFNSFLKGRTIQSPSHSRLAYELSFMMVREMLIKKVRIDRLLAEFKACGDITAAIRKVSGKAPEDFVPASIRKLING